MTLLCDLLGTVIRGKKIPVCKQENGSTLYTCVYLLCVLRGFRSVWLFATLWTAARQAPLSKGFCRQEYWSRLPCPTPWIYTCVCVCVCVYMHIYVYIHSYIYLAFLVAQTVKNLPAMWEAWVLSLNWEDPLEEGMAIHSRILAWRIPMDRGAWRAAVHRVAKSQTQLSV